MNKIILIGNASNVLDLEFGNKIDEFDIVVRFGRFWVRSISVVEVGGIGRSCGRREGGVVGGVEFWKGVWRNVVEKRS